MSSLDIDLAAKRVVTEVVGGEGLDQDLGQGFSPGYHGDSGDEPIPFRAKKKKKTMRLSFLDDSVNVHHHRSNQAIILDISFA